MAQDPPSELSPELSNNELSEIIRGALMTAGRLPRHAELFLCGICADHLVDQMRLAGLVVIRPPAPTRYS